MGLIVSWLVHVIAMSKIFLNRKERLYDDIFDVGQYLVDVFAFFSHVFPQACQTSLVTCIVCNALSLFKLRVLLVKRVVSEVNKHVLHHVFIRVEIDFFVRLCRESNKSLFVQKNLKRVTTHYKNVDSHIEFKSIDQVR